MTSQIFISYPNLSPLAPFPHLKRFGGHFHKDVLLNFKLNTILKSQLIIFPSYPKLTFPYGMTIFCYLDKICSCLKLPSSHIHSITP